MNLNVKYCEDCKYHKPSEIIIFGFRIYRHAFEDKCLHPKIADLHVRNSSRSLCIVERNQTDCGREGKLWEPKEF